MEFRPVGRKKSELSREECLEILRNTKRGVIAVLGDGGYPYAVPVNHYYNDGDGMLYFHGGMKGHKVDAMRRNAKVSFCVIDDGTPDEGSDWILRFRSVVVFGQAVFIEDRDKVEDMTRKLSYKFTDDEGYINQEIARGLDRTLMYAIRIEHISGRTVQES